MIEEFYRFYSQFSTKIYFRRDHAIPPKKIQSSLRSTFDDLFDYWNFDGKLQLAQIINYLCLLNHNDLSPFDCVCLFLQFENSSIINCVQF